MLLFIVTGILMAAVGAVLYLMVRALPRVAEEPSERRGVVDRLAHSEIPEKLDAAIDAFLIKLLRKVKVFIMQLDNALSKHLRKINVADDGGTKVAVDFKEFVNGHAADEKELQNVA
jgi:hypothetical protein